MWRVSSRSSVATWRTAIHLLLTYSSHYQRLQPMFTGSQSRLPVVTGALFTLPNVDCGLSTRDD